MKTACVMGCGWLGLPVAKALQSQGWVVVGTTTRLERLAGLSAEGIDARLYRIGDPEPPATDILIVNTPPSRTGSYVDDLRATSDGLPDRTRIVFVSSTSVYAGRQDIHPVEAVVPGRPEPIDDTLRSKHSAILIGDLIRAEGVFRERHRCAVLRFGGLTGPGRESGRILAGRTDVPDPDGPVNLTPLTLATDAILSVIQDGHWDLVRNVVIEPRPTRRDHYTRAAIDLGLEPPSFI